MEVSSETDFELMNFKVGSKAKWIKTRENSQLHLLEFQPRNFENGLLEKIDMYLWTSESFKLQFKYLSLPIGSTKSFKSILLLTSISTYIANNCHLSKMVFLFFSFFLFGGELLHLFPPPANKGTHLILPNNTNISLQTCIHNKKGNVGVTTKVSWSCYSILGFKFCLHRSLHFMCIGGWNDISKGRL